MDRNSLHTRIRLLEAASDVFAEKGYQGATFREICRLAKANIAAVNYHFGDKQQFYLAVLEYNIENFKHLVHPAGLDSNAPAPDRLRMHIRNILSILLGADRPLRLLKLVFNESANPTIGLDLIVEKCSLPVHAEIRAIAAEILGKAANSRVLDDCALSIVAQCLLFHHAPATVARVSSYCTYDEETIAHLTEHIWEFSMGALRAIGASALARQASPPLRK